MEGRQSLLVLPAQGLGHLGLKRENLSLWNLLGGRDITDKDRYLTLNKAAASGSNLDLSRDTPHLLASPFSVLRVSCS